MTKALLFDLDDTLYAERQFVRSGFSAVAAEVERRFGVPRRDALATLVGALRRGNRNRALQELCARHLLPGGIVPDLVDTIRAHVPSLRLPEKTLATLQAARDAGWRLGVVTNGFPAVQARKAAALGLGRLVDAIVYASEWGTGTGKPERAVFEVALAKVGARAPHSVFVGDDPRCDVFGAQQAGLRAILLCRHARREHLAACAPDAVILGLDEVIRTAADLLSTEVANAA
ncbi:MAG: HAD family hydrolase [Acidobacteria bacterium]|nr:HAD family hydrolase [Acidobacteriota bacterium]